jgi:hypothetical protein
MKNNLSNIDLRLSGQRALCGNIPTSLRSVSAEFRNNKIVFQCIFDGNPSDDDKELLSIAATEIIADFPDINEIDEQFLAVKYPEKFKDLENLLYLKYEKIQK